MSRVEEWIGGFVINHRARCPREDWPSASTEEGFSFFDAWRSAFVTRGITETFADEASLELAIEPPKYRSDHLAALVRIATELRHRENAGIVEGGSPTVEAARIASRDCQDCQGSGLTIRYVHSGILGRLKAASGDPVPVGARVGFRCSCALGRWYAHANAKDGQVPPTVGDDPVFRRASHWWSQAPDGLGNRHSYRPDQWSDEFECPLGAGDVGPETFEEGIAYLKSLTARFRLPRHAPATLPPSEFRPHDPDPIEPIPGRPDLEDAIADPIVARELGIVPVPEPEPAYDGPDEPEDTRDFGADGDVCY